MLLSMYSDISTEFNSDLLINNLESSGLTNKNFPDLSAYPILNTLSVKQKQGNYHFFTFHRSHPVYAGTTAGLSPKEQDDLLSLLPKLDDYVTLIVLGMGLGDHVDFIISKTRAKVVVLEKNPAFVKMALSRFQWQNYFRDEKLTVLDPLYYINKSLITASSLQLLNHPLTGKCFFDVAHIVNNPKNAQSIDLLMDGKLMIDDWYTTLVDSGRMTYIYPPNYYSVSKIKNDFQSRNIRKIWSINRISGLKNLAEELHLPYSIYEIDPDLSQIPAFQKKNKCTILFSYRKPNAGKYSANGWNSVYLPLATNEKRFNVQPQSKYQARLSFVGSSMLANADRIKKQLLKLCNKEQQNVITTFWQDQATNPETFKVPEYQDQISSVFPNTELQSEQGPMSLLKSLAEWSGACHRIHMVRQAARFGIDVWGEENWKLIADKTPGMNYRGRAAHLNEVPRIYASSYINLDVTRIYQPDVATLRLFDVFAAGSLVVSNIEGENGELYPDPRLLTYIDSTSLINTIEDILSWSEQKYNDYVNAMHSYTLAHHTFSNRLKSMLDHRENVNGGI